MIKQIFTNIYASRHFWRRASSSDVAKLYATRLMRTIAINVGAAFMSVYMVKSGYSIVSVSLFWAGYFGFKVLVMMPLAQFIANYGPRVSIIISNFLYIPSMISFIFLPQLGIWALIITAILQSTSAALYDVSHAINFSKANRVEKAGGQVAWMSIFEQIAKGLSPLIGGLLAMFFDPRASIAFSAIFFMLAAFPLMRSEETSSRGFKLAPKGFPWRLTARSLLIQLPIGFDTYASGNAWSIFLASVIFVAGGNQVYAELGALTSIVFIVSIVATRLYGKLIDSRSGGKLLFWAAAGNVLVHLSRILVRNPLTVLGTNTAKEVAASGYLMAFTRGMFDVANQSGYRVFYIGLSNLLANAGALFASLALAAGIALFDSSNGFIAFYILTALITSLIMLSKFRVYRQA